MDKRGWDVLDAQVTDVEKYCIVCSVEKASSGKLKSGNSVEFSAFKQNDALSRKLCLFFIKEPAGVALTDFSYWRVSSVSLIAPQPAVSWTNGGHSWIQRVK